MLNLKLNPESGLTGSPDGLELLHKCPEIIPLIANLTEDPAETVAKDSLLCLVNISAEAEGAKNIIDSVSSIFLFSSDSNLK